MTEREITDILNGHILSADHAESALLSAYQDVTLRILGRLIKNLGLNDEDKEMLAMIVKTKCMLGLIDVANVESGGTPIPGGSQESFLNVYGKSMVAINFLITNYDRMNWSNMAQQLTPKILRELSQKMKSHKLLYLQLLNSNYQFTVDSEDPKIINAIFSMGCRVMMGSDTYKVFMAEVNQAYELLRKLQVKLMVFGDQNQREN